MTEQRSETSSSLNQAAHNSAVVTADPALPQTSYRRPLNHPLYRFASMPLILGILGTLVLMYQSLEVDPFPLGRVMAPLFIGFGLFKGALGLSTLLMMLAQDRQSEDIIEEYGSRGSVIGWACYKISACVIAVGAGFWIMSF